MAEYALVRLSDSAVIGGTDSTRESAAFPPDISHKGWEWRPVIEVGRTDPVGADQIKEGPVQTVNLTDVTNTWTVRNMTAQEIIDRDAAADRDAIRSALLDVAEIEISLIDALLLNATIATTDFPVDTRTKFQDLKARVDRLRT